jgi:hypothetical protein
VVAGLTHINSTSALNYTDRPLDVLFVIEQLAALNEEAGNDLAGVMNIDQIGVIGFSGGTFTALTASGARVDTVAASRFDDLVGIDLLRGIFRDWDWTTMAAYHDQFMPTGEDAMWPPMTDPRIRAVVAYLPCSPDFFGERGMAAATIPTLLIGGTADEICTYVGDAVEFYRKMGSAERYLITLVGARHTLPSQTAPVVSQFVTAFFGYYLQGKSEYESYLTEDYAKTLDDVVWGIDMAMINNFSLYVGELNRTDGGEVAVGDAITGEIANLGTRLEYTLTVDTNTSLNVYANATGPRTNDQSGMSFIPVLYIYDTQGDLLFWTEHGGIGDDFLLDGSIEGADLTAGNYTIEVRGWGDILSGPYELIVESAAGD